MNEEILTKKTPLYQRYFPYLIIIGLVLFVYIQNFWFDFIYFDDQLVFVEYNKIDSITKIPGAFLEGYLFNNYYRPLIMVSFIVDTAVGGQSSFIYHLSNLILHIVVSILLYNLLVKIRLEKDISLLLTLFFAVHPINTNAVSWIMGRNDLFPALFSLVSFLSFVSFVNKKKTVFLSLSILSYILAMLSKEVGVIIPVLFIFYYLLLERKRKLNLKQYLTFLVYLIPAGAYFFLRIFGSHIIIRDKISIQSFIQNIHILFEYIAKIFYFPAIEPLPIKNNFSIIVGIIFILIFLFAFIKQVNDNKNKRIFLFGILFFLLSVLLPMFVEINSGDGKFYYDCRVYLPMIGILISLGAVLQSFNIEFFKKRIIVFLVIISFIYTISYTLIKNGVYRNDKIFWSTVTKLHPQRGDYLNGLGNYYFRHGDYTKAIQLGEKALKLYSDKSRAFFYLFQLYIQVGDLINAELVTKSLIDIAVETGKSEYVLQASEYCLQNGKIKMAININRALIERKPNDPVYLNNYGCVLYKIGDTNSAKEYFYKALQLAPDNKQYLTNLSLCK